MYVMLVLALYLCLYCSYCDAPCSWLDSDAAPPWLDSGSPWLDCDAGCLPGIAADSAQAANDGASSVRRRTCVCVFVKNRLSLLQL